MVSINTDDFVFHVALKLRVRWFQFYVFSRHSISLEYIVKSCVTKAFISSAMGPIGSLSARQFNSCLPRKEEEKEEGFYLTHSIVTLLS